MTQMFEQHDFKKFPELTNNQMQFHYFSSPHKQITEDFWCNVEEVIDGDTLRVKWLERDFPFRVRLLGVGSPELKERGGLEARDWLKSKIEGEEVLVIIDDRERVGKWGRLLGTIIHKGININEQIIDEGKAVEFGEELFLIPNFSRELDSISENLKNGF